MLNIHSIKIFRKNSIITYLFNLLFLLVICNCIRAQSFSETIPQFGAEVFIEPGQLPSDIDGWFKEMSKAGMTITRIRLFENYMHNADDSWDFSIFDSAYKAGEKYGIKIYGNLFPATSFSDVGGFKFANDDTHLNSIAAYIKKIVTHFKQFSSCIGWVPVNEPGSGGILPKNEYTSLKMNEWIRNEHTGSDKDSNSFQHLSFTEEKFLRYYNSSFLNWLSKEIRKYDSTNEIHVNSHAIFSNVAEYDFPEWRKFLNTLGSSAHASWHFNYFTRPQYAVAMSANSEIIRSGAGKLPWMMTELQGGNNTYSGNVPMCPTADEIAQWLWITTSTEAKGNIFWCLNPRSSGYEAGEWGMLDYQNKPTDRMNAAKEIINTIHKNSTLFNDTKVQESGINILYTRQSLWIENKLQIGNTYYAGRSNGGVMKSALSYFEALSEMGIQSNLKEMGEFDFSKDNYTGISIILANQISIPSAYNSKIAWFVKNGGKIIADGLTGFYDENAICKFNTGFPLQTVFGGNIIEFKTVENLFTIRLDKMNIDLYAHLWQGYIAPTTAKIIGYDKGKNVIAVRNMYGNGEVVWIPTLAGLASRLNNDYRLLAMFLEKELSRSLNTVPVRFIKQYKNMLMKTLRTTNGYVSVIVNKGKKNQVIPLQLNSTLKSAIIYANKRGSIAKNTVTIHPEETMVIKWE